MRRSQRGSLAVAVGILACCLLLSGSASHADPVSLTVTVDPDAQFQTIEGWGTSLAWWANLVGGYPDSYRSDYITRVFDPVDGLGLNIVRYNIGGGEAPEYHSMELRANVPGFEPARDTWDWTADANQRWVLQQAIAHGANIVEAFSVSPPAWMTNSGSVTGAKDGGDNLDPASYAAFADYLSEVVKHYQDSWGIRFRSLEPLNEPVAPWWKFGGRQEGCHFDRASQRGLIQQVSTSLAAHGLATALSASDENSINEALTSLNSYDPTTLLKVSQVNVHDYGGTSRLLLRRAAIGAGKRLWMSEYGDNDASGMTLSKTILADMRELQPTAWLYWQAVDSAGVWGCLDNPEDGKTFGYTANEKYYVFGNYTKFIRPGYVMVAASDANSLAAYDATTQTLVIVTTNPTTNDTDVTYDLTHLSSFGAIQPYVTSASLQLAPQSSPAAANGQFQFRLPAASVTTLVIHDARRGEPRFDPAKYYTLVAKNSGMALSASDGTPSVPVQMPDSGAPSQQWQIATVGGYYKLVNRASGLCLSIEGASQDPSAYAALAANTDASDCQWQIIYDGGGFNKVINRYSLMNLDVYGQLTTAGTRIDQYTDAGTTNQRWSIVPVP